VSQAHGNVENGEKVLGWLWWIDSSSWRQKMKTYNIIHEVGIEASPLAFFFRKAQPVYLKNSAKEGIHEFHRTV